MEGLADLFHRFASTGFETVQVYPVFADFFESDAFRVDNTSPVGEFYERSLVVCKGPGRSIEFDFQVLEEFLNEGLYFCRWHRDIIRRLWKL